MATVCSRSIVYLILVCDAPSCCLWLHQATQRPLSDCTRDEVARRGTDPRRAASQGGGKRNGSFAMYLEPWHADIFDVLDLKKNHGKEEARARDLFYAMWCPDLFMKRVEADGECAPRAALQSPAPPRRAKQSSAPPRASS